MGFTGPLPPLFPKLCARFGKGGAPVKPPEGNLEILSYRQWDILVLTMY